MDDDNEEKDTPLVDDDPEEKDMQRGVVWCVCVVSVSWLGCDAMATAERVCATMGRGLTMAR